MAGVVPVPSDGQTYQADQEELPNVKARSLLNLGSGVIYFGFSPALNTGTAIPLPAGGQYPIMDKRPIYVMNPSNSPAGSVQVLDSVGQFAQVIPQTRQIDTWTANVVSGATNVNLQNSTPGNTYGNNHVVCSIRQNAGARNVTLTFTLTYTATGQTVSLCVIPGNSSTSGTGDSSSTDVSINPGQAYTISAAASGALPTCTLTCQIVPE